MDGQPVDTNTSVQTPTDINNTSVQNPTDINNTSVQTPTNTTQDSICDKPDIAKMEDKSIINIDNIQENIEIENVKNKNTYDISDVNFIKNKYIEFMNNYKDNKPQNNTILINELNNEVNIFKKKFNEFFKADGGSYIKSREIFYDESKNEFYKLKDFGILREKKDISYIIDHIAKYKAIKYLYLTTKYCKHIQELPRDTMNQLKKRLEEYLFTNSIIAQGILNRVDNMANNIIRSATLGTVQHAVRLTRGGNKRKTKKKPHRKKMRKTRSITKSQSKVKKM